MQSGLRLSSDGSRTCESRTHHRLGKRLLGCIAPVFGGRSNLNFIMDEGQDRVKASYRENYDRLVAIKNRYDPTNLFRVNQNIKPSV